MEDIILSIPVMKKSVLFPIFKLYCPIVHFYHILHLLSSFKKMDKFSSNFHGTKHQATRTAVPGGTSPVTSQLNASGDSPGHRAGRGK